ncbi:MAG: saccharopine dehydrogenase C-terminal domain-containing protein [Nanoarchaeota archaeon]
MKFDFAVVGATGMQGRIVTKDLLTNGYSVLLCGRDRSRVRDLLRNKKTSFAYLDLTDEDAAKKVIRNSGAKVVINCAEGNWNFEALKMFIDIGVNSIDLGSDIPILKKQLAMNNELKKKGLIHITGCGSVPGIGDVMLRYAYEKFDRIDTIRVGFAWTSNLKVFVVPFSIQSILEEFTMNAPYLHHSKIVRVKPTNSIVRIYHRAVGRENQFKVGHHPETYTFYEYCKNKGIKNLEFYAGFPDHSMNIIKMLVDLGFADKKKVDFRGQQISPDEFLTAVLKRLKYPPGYKETENLWVEIEGSEDGKKRSILMECIVPPLKGWEDAGCNIDTGMPASIIAQMIFKKIITKSGSYSPEEIVPVQPFFKELRKRKMLVYENGKVIN